MEEKPQSWWDRFRERAHKGGERFEAITRKWCTSEKMKAAGGKIAEESRECVDACKRTLTKFRHKNKE